LKKSALKELRLRGKRGKGAKRERKRFKRLEPTLRKTITFDQGKENSEYIPREHKELSEQHTAMRVYFCHPPFNERP
jgi:IS30 family transposase